MSGQRARAWCRMANWPWPRSPGSHGCCKQWIQDRETVHSTRWRSGEPRQATVATTRGWTVVESPTGWTVFQVPSTPSGPLSRRIGDVRAGSTGDCCNQQGSAAGRRPQAGRSRGLQAAPWRRDLAMTAWRIAASPSHSPRIEQPRSFRPPSSFRVLWSSDPIDVEELKLQTRTRTYQICHRNRSQQRVKQKRDRSVPTACSLN